MELQEASAPTNVLSSAFLSVRIKGIELRWMHYLATMSDSLFAGHGYIFILSWTRYSPYYNALSFCYVYQIADIKFIKMPLILLR